MTIQWSNSSDGVLQRCQRKFWFQYVYASPRSKWGSPRREINILSNVQTLEQWRGNLVHAVIADYVIPCLERGNLPVLKELQAFAIERARRQLNFSSARRYREPGVTKTGNKDSFAAIWEDEFDSAASRLTQTEALQEISLALENLSKLRDLLNELRTSSWRVPEASIRIEEYGIPVVGRMDLMAAYNGTSKSLRLIDWKLDRQQSHDYAPQLWLYAYLLAKADSYQDVSYRRQTIPRWVKILPKSLIEVNLLHGNVLEHTWNDRIMRTVEDRIFRSTRKIHALLDGRDPDQVDGGELHVTENPNNCDFCPFRQPCQAF